MTKLIPGEMVNKKLVVIYKRSSENKLFWENFCFNPWSKSCKKNIRGT